MSAKQAWKSLGTPVFNLHASLGGGQSFRWKHNVDKNEWTGIFHKTVWKLKQNENELLYSVIGSLCELEFVKDKSENKKSKKKKNSNSNEAVIEANDDDSHEKILRGYLRLDENLDALYEEWASKDKIFASVADKFYGVRMLAQEPVENLFSFICSQNNHISRISSMIEKLCSTYGQKICEDNEISYYSFPTANNLCGKKVEGDLRHLGFGYRAKFIQQSAEKIREWGEDEWFESLKKMPYKEAKMELIKLPGIGPKVADCICLMSLNHLEAVPVDTHVYQIAANNYLTHLKGLKSVTDKVYNEIGDHFRDLYGPLAGWAHTVLFCADLKMFAEPGSKRISTEENSKKKKVKKK